MLWYAAGCVMSYQCTVTAGKPIYELKDSLRHVKTSSFSDDEPAYDIVASDEDYSSLGDRASIKEAAAAAAEQPGQVSEPTCFSTTVCPLSLAICCIGSQAHC